MMMRVLYVGSPRLSMNVVRPAKMTAAIATHSAATMNQKVRPVLNRGVLSLVPMVSTAAAFGRLATPGQRRSLLAYVGSRGRSRSGTQTQQASW